VLAARPLAADERESWSAVRLHAVHVLMPYLASAVFRLRPCAVDGLDTWAVDDAWRVLVDPTTFTRWGVQGCAGVLLHEVGHALRDHAAQAAGEGSWLDPWAWNLCADAAINDDLVRSGVRLPGAPVLPDDLQDRQGRPLQPGGTAVQYYAALPRVGQDGDGRAGDGVTGDGAAGRQVPGTRGGRALVVPGRRGPVDGSCGPVAGGPALAVDLADAGVEVAAGVDPVDRELVRHAVARDVTAAAAAAPGRVPAGLRRWAEAALEPARVDWRQQLRGAVRRGLATTAGIGEHTHARPSRRRVPGVVLPGQRRRLPRVACVVDTSASMGRAELEAVLAEVEALARAAGGRDGGCTLLAVDAAVHEVRRVAGAADVVLRGGGGTDLRPGLAAAVARPAPADVVVVLTDGGTPWDAVPPSRVARFVVARTLPPGPVPSWSTVPSWATPVEVEVVRQVDPSRSRRG